MENQEAIKKSVSNGMGVSIISRLAAEEEIAEGAISVKPDMTVVMCKNNQEAIHVLNEIVKKEDAMMIKGSRSMKTDEIVKAFL